MISKKIIVPALAVLVIGGGAFAATEVNAQTQGTPNIVQMIAQKFNLNQNDVQAVFDQAHQQQMANRQTKINDKLTQAVTNGTITNAQKEAIDAKLKELETQRQNNKDQFKNMTPEQRKAAIEKEMQDLQQWAKDNNLDLSKLKGIIGFGFGPRGKIMMMKNGAHQNQ